MLAIYKSNVDLVDIFFKALQTHSGIATMI